MLPLCWTATTKVDAGRWSRTNAPCDLADPSSIPPTTISNARVTGARTGSASRRAESIGHPHRERTEERNEQEDRALGDHRQRREHQRESRRIDWRDHVRAAPWTITRRPQCGGRIRPRELRWHLNRRGESPLRQELRLTEVAVRICAADRIRAEGHARGHGPHGCREGDRASDTREFERTPESDRTGNGPLPPKPRGRRAGRNRGKQRPQPFVRTQAHARKPQIEATRPGDSRGVNCAKARHNRE
jgi:hypothetical protein